MDKRKILIQLDTDAHASVFDRVVAIDAGVDELFSYSRVEPGQVRDLVHGAIFTRGPKDLKSTAIFIGGSDVAAGEKLLEETRKHLLPQYGLQVSLMLDSNGANTTAAAAVHAASRHLPLGEITACVLAGTGPVGQRVGHLLARHGARVRLGSRQRDRAAAVCERIRQRLGGGTLEAVATATPAGLRQAVADSQLVISAGAAGALLLPRDVRAEVKSLKVAIDLNAVPPAGIEGVEVVDKGADRDGVVAYGAIGVGGTKMKLHKAAVARLFESNSQVMDIEEIYALASGLQ